MRVVGGGVDAQHVLDDAFGLRLQAGVEPGAHGENAVVAEFSRVGERLHFLIGEVDVPVGAGAVGLTDGRRRIAPRRIDLPLGHEAGVDEIAQDVVGARARGGQIDVRGIFGRGLEQAGEHRRLGEIDVARRLAEIILRRRLHAERAAAHVGAIEIEAQDLLLGQMVLEPQRQIGFLDLARNRALVGQEQVLGELLGDRRAALHDAAGVGVDGQGAQRADHVDAEMVEEAAILGGQHRLDEMVGQFVEGDRVVVLDAAPADLHAVAIEKGDGEILALQPILVAGLAKRRQRQGQDDDQSRQAEVQAFAQPVDDELARPGKMQAIGNGRRRLQRADRSALGVVERRIHPGVEREQRSRGDFPIPGPRSSLDKAAARASARATALRNQDLTSAIDKGAPPAKSRAVRERSLARSDAL